VLAAQALFLLLNRPMKYRQMTVAALLLLAAAGPARALELHAERSSPYDLALTGMLSGVPAGESRYARWADLRALPSTRLRMNGEFVDGPQELTVVFLDDLWKALPIIPGADCVLATCADGYASVFTSEFISKYRPFLVLEINGKGPRDWPPPGLAFNPGPFVITVSSDLVPAVAGYRDIEHKKPWGVTSLEIASYAERYRAIYSGKWADLPPGARDGREIWVNSCASCHQGPGGIFGGTKADRPFQVIAAYAGYDRAYFIRYVRDPKSLVPCAKMEPHPKYVDNDLSDLIAFITSGQKG
jgi:cytochrome c2